MTADADTRLTPRLFPTAGFQIITEHGVHLKIFHAWMERVTGRKSILCRFFSERQLCF